MHQQKINQIQNTAGDSDVKGIYTCSTHSEVRKMGPGVCPKCGMVLEPLVDTGPTPHRLLSIPIVPTVMLVSSVTYGVWAFYGAKPALIYAFVNFIGALIMGLSGKGELIIQQGH